MSFPVNRHSKTVHKHKNLFSWKQANLPQNPFFCEFYSILNLFSHKKQCIAIDKLRYWSMRSLELCFLFTPNKKKMTLSHPLLVCLWTCLFSAARTVSTKLPPPSGTPSINRGRVLLRVPNRWKAYRQQKVTLQVPYLCEKRELRCNSLFCCFYCRWFAFLSWPARCQLNSLPLRGLPL